MRLSTNGVQPQPNPQRRFSASAKTIAGLLLLTLLLTAVGVGIAMAQPPSIVISIDFTKEVSEANGTVTVTVKLSAVSTETVTVQFNTSTSGADATADVDYESKSGTLIFAPGETVKTITVKIIDDPIEEPTEGFHVELSNPVNAIIYGTNWRCTVYIIDDDGPPPMVQFQTMGATVSEFEAAVVLHVGLNAKAPAQVTVKYSTKDCPLVNGATGGCAVP
jgi:endoglucanase